MEIKYCSVDCTKYARRLGAMVRPALSCQGLTGVVPAYQLSD